MILVIVMIMLLFVGAILVAINITKNSVMLQSNKPIYRYIPSTFDEMQEDPIPVSDVFETLFSQPSPWIASVRTYDRKKQERINNYFVSQL